MSTAFVSLVSALCQDCGFAIPERVVNGEAFDVGLARCTLSYNRQITHEHLYVYVDFGMVPIEQEGIAYDFLLRANFQCRDSQPSCFSVSPTSGHVVLVCRFDLATISAENLRDFLYGAAAEVLEWRSTLQTRRTPHEYQRYPSSSALIHSRIDRQSAYRNRASTKNERTREIS